MDKYKLKFTTLQNEIFRLLCIKTGEQLTQREIAHLLDVSPTGVAKALPGLGNHIRKAQGKHANLISLNRTQQTLKHKQLENLKQLYESKLILELEEQHPGMTIILFGSYARGEDTLTSDIDIAIIGQEKHPDLKTYEEVLERKITINYYDSLKSIHKELRENLCNGITLAGGITL